MATANVMTFNDPGEPIRIRFDFDQFYVYWQVGTYLALNRDEAVKLRDDLSRAITEAAQQHAQAIARDAQEVTP